MTTSMIAELVLSKRFDASPEQVFDAWTGTRWVDWLPPRDATAKIISIDPRVGGTYQVDMIMPDGRQVGASGRYVLVDRPHRLTFTWLGSYSPAQTTIALVFVTDGSGTLMTLTQTGFDEDGMRNGYEQGWGGPGGSFDKLSAILGGHARA